MAGWRRWRFLEGSREEKRAEKTLSGERDFVDGSVHRANDRQQRGQQLCQQRSEGRAAEEKELPAREASESQLPETAQRVERDEDVVLAIAPQEKETQRRSDALR